MIRFRLPLAAAAALTLLAACDTRSADQGPPPGLSEAFRLGHLYVRAENVTKSPVSRSVSDDAWKIAVESAVKKRLTPMQGQAWYHLGITVDGYALAPPGIPLIASPKSVLILSVTAMADAEGGKKLNEEPEQITVFESASGDQVLGTGFTKTAEEQMANLAANAALSIEEWLGKNPQFFKPEHRARPLEE